MTLLWVAAAGSLGAAARFLIDATVTDRAGAVFPWGTLIVNTAGSLLAGLVVGVALEGGLGVPLLVGFLGGFTTFSTFAYETLQLVREGVGQAAAWNIAANVLGGSAAALVGLLTGGLLR